MNAVFLVTLPHLCAAALALWQLISHASAPPSVLKSAVKTAAVALLALPVWGAGLSGADRFILAGLLFGAVGDFCLSRPGKAAFLAGMAAFAAGHLAYLLAFLALGHSGIDPFAALAVSLAGLGAFLFLAPRAGDLAVPVRLYCLVILAMVLAALRVSDARLVAGALLFMASDLLLALQLFVLPEGRVQVWAARGVWALYWPAQALIAAATL